MKVFIYNTTSNVKDSNDKMLRKCFPEEIADKVIASKGKLIASYELKKIKSYINGCQFYKDGIIGDYKDFESILVPAHFSEDQLFDYCDDLAFYAIEINNIQVFEEPISIACLDPYELPKSMNEYLYGRFNPPQSMCRARYKGEEVIVISNRPSTNALILEGSKTIEIRKTILDCMKQYLE